MSDSEIVASIVAGDPEGLAAAYDKYASDLHGYCRSLLHDPNDAADAVQDTFVIAVSKLAGLRDPERLRAWLFAVARNECLHRLKSRRAATPLHDAPELPDDSVDVGGAAERAETVALVRAAVGGLNEGERDVINQLWHGLDVPEAAAVLGVSRNYAYTLFSRARDQLESSVAVLLVGRAGRRDCATLDSLLGDWDGRLTALLRKRVGRHIERCEVCSDRRRRELTPALLYGVSPVALLAMAALRGLPAAAGQAAGSLYMVRDAVVGLAADPAARATAYARATTRSMLSFRGNGFPRPAHHGLLGVLHRPHLPLTVAGGTAVAATATVVATAVVPGLGHPRLSPNAGPSVGVPVPGGPASAGVTWTAPSTVRGSRPPGKATRAHATSPAGSGLAASAATSAVPTVTATGIATSSGTVTATGTGTSADGTTGSVGAAASVTVAPVATAAITVAVAPVSAASTPAAGVTAAGTLSVSPSTVLLSPLLGGQLTLTATGGPVTWSITEPTSLISELAVTPSSGTLTAGESDTVRLTVAGLVSLDTTLVVQPGGHTVTVVLGLG